MLTDLDEEWLNFTENTYDNKKDNTKKINKDDIVKNVSDIYISTKTKIAFLNHEIDLFNLFWKIPIIKYHLPNDGILKKSIKFNCSNKTETEKLNNLLNENKQEINKYNLNITTISDIKTANKYKDVRKIDIGLSKKELYSCRRKKKGAFYNCFAIIMRIKFNNEYKEVHIKIFNTGKLEIPGIREEKLLIVSLNKLSVILSNLMNKEITYNKNSIQNVLINSNFNCGFYINRAKLHQLLKFEYNLQPIYDPCSYPGIQCKFYYNIINKDNNGLCICKNKCYLKKKKEKKECMEISFMIFRTGSVLIVGHCNEKVLNIVYTFIKNLLINEYENIHQIGNIENKKKKSIPKIRKKNILISIK